jgi:hypothetical protein
MIDVSIVVGVAISQNIVGVVVQFTKTVNV